MSTGGRNHVSVSVVVRIVWDRLDVRTRDHMDVINEFNFDEM